MAPPALSLVMPFRGERDLNFALALGTVIAMREMREHHVPPLYSSGVRYARDVCKAAGVRGACEPFKSPLETLRARVGDCDDLGIWRAAELRLAGERASAQVRKSAAGWHVIVVHADGSEEDPSIRLGMKGTR